MSTSNLALLDTNILIAAVFSQHTHHTAARPLLEKARTANANFAVLPQNFAEFYAGVTRPAGVPRPLRPDEALGALQSFSRLPGLTVLDAPADMTARLLELASRRAVTGRHVYDLMLVAAMLGNGVRRIYTFNDKDFTPFAELEVVVPLAGQKV